MKTMRQMPLHHASGKEISRKDPVQLTDPMMLLLATTIFDQYGKKSEVLAVTTRQIRYMNCSSWSIIIWRKATFLSTNVQRLEPLIQESTKLGLMKLPFGSVPSGTDFHILYSNYSRAYWPSRNAFQGIRDHHGQLFTCFLSLVCVSMSRKETPQIQFQEGKFY